MEAECPSSRTRDKHVFTYFWHVGETNRSVNMHAITYSQALEMGAKKARQCKLCRLTELRNEGKGQWIKASDEAWIKVP